MKSVFKNIEKLIKSEKPFVAYRKPQDKEVNLMVQQDDTLYYLENFKQKGFVFAPFDDRGNTILFPFEKCEFSSFSVSKLEDIVIPEKEGRKDGLISSPKPKRSHLELVQKGIDFLVSENISKVVLSRSEEVSVGNILFGNLFYALLQNYPLAFVSLWYHPKVGLWLGATPEILVSVANKKFKTMALAGTQKFTGTTDVFWGEKEKEEQQIVTNFIVEQLKEFELKVSDPFTIKAGSLLHICTEIEGKLSDEEQLELLIRKLHPTPAVCGMPKETAKLFILENEKYNREFYAGFFGELHMNNVSDLYVNLRCMQVKNQKAVLYIGGGITKDSDPKREWDETIAKSEVMKSVLF